jgi:exodeoxyribonuclease V alpha subunit
MVVSYQHYIMLQRNLIYTGITRAKKLCFILGTKKAIHHASNTVPVQKRNTTLITRIYDFVAELEDEFDDEEYDEDDFEEVEEGEETFEQFEFVDF